MHSRAAAAERRPQTDFCGAGAARCSQTSGPLPTVYCCHIHHNIPSANSASRFSSAVLPLAPEPSCWSSVGHSILLLLQVPSRRTQPQISARRVYLRRYAIQHVGKKALWRPAAAAGTRDGKKYEGCRGHQSPPGRLVYTCQTCTRQNKWRIG
jgi:hypothetical protein